MADAVGRHEIGVGRASRDLVEHRLGFPSVAVAVGTGAQDGFGVEPNFIQKGREEHFSMRQRLFEHQKMRGPLDVKNGPGGLIDIEFLLQALILAYAADCPAIIAARGLAATLEKLLAADLHCESTSGGGLRQ